MTEAKHTELPWAVLQIRGGYQIWDIGGNELVATFTSDCVNPEFICQAVNNYGVSMEALEEVYDCLDMIAGEEDSKQWDDALNLAKQALAAAKGES